MPARIACLPTLKSKLSATSSVRVDPSLDTPAPPLLNASITMIAGASDIEADRLSCVVALRRGTR